MLTLEKIERSPINGLHLIEIENLEQIKFNIRDEIKIRAKINKIEDRRIEKVNKTNSWLFKRNDNNIDKRMARLIK